MTDITNTEVFKPLEAYIRTEEYTDIDLFNMIGEYAAIAPHVAQALAFQTRDILKSDFGGDDRSYTDILVELYWRTFFSPEHAGIYGTDHMVHDPATLAQFVQYVIDPTTIEASHVRIAALPVHRH